MLETLDAVDWTALEHAYGEATDVPDIVRALASRDERVRDQAFREAYGTIYHQGTRYSSTPAAIPFLIELASQPDAPGLADLLDLLVHCVGGSFTATYGPRTGSGSIWGERPSPMEDYGETAEILASCERAAEPAIPLCLRLVTSDAPDADVRRRACHLLAALHAFAPRYELVPRMREVLERDPDATVRAMAAFALAHLMPMVDGVILQMIAREDSEPLVRAVASMGCVRRGQATSELTPSLLAWLSDDALDARYKQLPFRNGDLDGDIAELIPLLGPIVLRDSLPLLLQQLPRVGREGAAGLVLTVLAAVFGPRTGAPQNAAQLSSEQRRVLQTIVASDAVWNGINVTYELAVRDFPSTREELRHYLGER